MAARRPNPPVPGRERRDLTSHLQARENRVAARHRRRARTQRYRFGLAETDVPMMPGTRILPLPEGVRSYAAADPENGVIYADGPLDRFTTAHESAHLLEKVMTDADRARFAQVMGRPKGQWWTSESSAHGDHAASQGYRESLGERFADLAALVATGYDPRSRGFDAGYLDRKPTRKRLLRFARALDRFGERNALPEYVRPRRG